jgi:hypothetical protein
MHEFGSQSMALQVCIPVAIMQREVTKAFAQIQQIQGFFFLLKYTEKEFKKKKRLCLGMDTQKNSDFCT